MTIARNAIIDHVRANRRLTILDADAYRHHLNLTSPDPAAHPVPPDERDRLLDALHHLSATQRRIVLLRVQGWNGVEIAELLGMSHGAVRVAQHRAYTRLRELLTAEPTTSSSRAFITEPDHA
jgi:RNA polymerase sigma factor (sigma-70 family)